MTTIEWVRNADGSLGKTWNPTVGCSKVSPGCDGCYAIDVAHRAMQPAHQGLTIRRPGERTDWTGEVRCLPERLDVPLRRRKPTTWFVDSMSDLFHKDVPDEFIVGVFAVMELTPRHTYQILTKRPQRMAKWVGDATNQSLVAVAVVDRLGVKTSEHGPYRTSGDVRRLGRAIGDARRAAGLDRYGSWPPLQNVWLGTSIESDRYVWRARHLRQTPAVVRWLSLEPLLGPLPSLDLTGIDWVVVGGESGPGARPMHPDWVRDIRDRCIAAGIPFHFKQWGAWAPAPWSVRVCDPAVRWQGTSEELAKAKAESEAIGATHAVSPDGHLYEPSYKPWSIERTRCEPHAGVRRVGKKAAGRELDGRTWDQMPQVARARA